jgi:hypothetical protein
VIWSVFIGAWVGGGLYVIVVVKSASFWRRHKKAPPMNVNTCRHCSQEIREINGEWWSSSHGPFMHRCPDTQPHAPLPPTAEKGYECANARLVKTPNGYHLPRSIIVDDLLGILRDA